MHNLSSLTDADDCCLWCDPFRPLGKHSGPIHFAFSPVHPLSGSICASKNYSTPRSPEDPLSLTGHLPPRVLAIWPDSLCRAFHGVLHDSAWTNLYGWPTLLPRRPNHLINKSTHQNPEEVAKYLPHKFVLTIQATINPTISFFNL